MNTALLISGKCPIDYKNYFDSINQTLIEPYNSDVFISTWFGDFDQKELIDLYKPSSIKIENFDGESISKKLNGFSDFLIQNNIEVSKSMYPMFYKLYTVNQLRLSYFKKYDLIIRTRFDLSFGEKMECSTIEPFIFSKIDNEEIKDSIEHNNLYLRLDPFYGNRIINDWVWDQFAFGNDYNMNIYCNTFLKLKEILLSKRQNTNVNEMILSYNLRDNNVSMKHTHTTYRISNYV